MGNADFKQGKRKKIQEENFVSCEEKIQSVYEVTNQGRFLLNVNVVSLCKSEGKHQKFILMLKINHINYDNIFPLNCHLDLKESLEHKINFQLIFTGLLHEFIDILEPTVVF